MGESTMKSSEAAARSYMLRQLQSSSEQTNKQGVINSGRYDNEEVTIEE